MTKPYRGPFPRRTAGPARARPPQEQITIKPDIVAAIAKISRLSGRPVSDVVNELLAAAINMGQIHGRLFPLIIALTAEETAPQNADPETPPEEQAEGSAEDRLAKLRAEAGLPPSNHETETPSAPER